MPYYLLFYPDNQELTLFHHGGRKYRAVKPNAAGRLALPELELEAALLDGWVRYWFRGELLPLPADLQRELEDARRQLRRTQADLDVTRRDLDVSRRDLDASRRDHDVTRRDLDASRQQNERLRERLRQLGVEPDEA